MRKLRFEDLYPPEYYYEQAGMDCRLAIKKFHDARDTMGMAQLALSYISEDNKDDFEKNYVKSIHLRHAIEDLNNSFDLLLQIPWFYYRAWSEFNRGGSLRNNSLKNRADIVRNTDDWVYSAEQACSYNKLIAYLASESNTLESKYEGFWKSYVSVEESQKVFTVRSLCNTLKHNHALRFKELYEPYDFNININGKTTNLRKAKMSVKFHQEFHDDSNPNVKLGCVNYEYIDDLSVDIEFYSGDKFRFSDCAGNTGMIGLYDAYTECCKYYDELIGLFEDIYAEIYPAMQLLPSFIGVEGRPNIIPSNQNIDLNKYFSKL